MNPSERTLSRVVGVITHTIGANVTEEQLRGTTRLDNLAPLDSLALLEFTIGLEREFAIELEPDHMNREFLVNLPALLDYLEERSGAQLR